MQELAGTSSDQLSSPVVLLVEDDVAVRSTLAAILHDEGCNLLIAPNGFDALVALENHRPDVVVLDWMMPVLDGEKFLHALRHEYQRTTPVLVLTASRVAEEAARAAGADAFLRKPFQIDDLMRELHRLLDEARQA